MAARRGAVLVACAAVCWSSGGLVARLVATSPWTTSLWRGLFASLFLTVALWVWLVLSERPGMASLAGGALILAALLANAVVDLVASRA